MKTIYPDQNFESFEEWREYISRAYHLQKHTVRWNELFTKYFSKP